MQKSSAFRETSEELGHELEAKDKLIVQFRAQVNSLESQMQKQSLVSGNTASELKEKLQAAMAREAKLTEGHGKQKHEAAAANEKLAELTSVMERQQNDLESFSRVSADLNSQLSTSAAKIKDLSSANAQLTSDLERSHSDVSALKAVLEQKQLQHQNQGQQRDSTVKYLHREMDALQSRLNELEGEKQTVEAELSSRITSADSLKQLADTRLEEITMLQKSAARLRHENEQLEGELAEFQQELPVDHGLQERCRQLEKQVELVESEEQQLRRLLAEKTKDLLVG